MLLCIDDTKHGYHRDDWIPLATQGISKMYSRLTVETVHFTARRSQKCTSIVIPSALEQILQGKSSGIH